MPASRLFARIIFAMVLSVATAAVMLPTKSVAAASPAHNCCAKMPEQPGNCPPPAQSPSGSCCNLPACLHLFLQISELDLTPASSDVEWANFVASEMNRPERPAIPPPRA